MVMNLQYKGLERQLNIRVRRGRAIFNLPSPTDLLRLAKDWISAAGEETGLGFYTATGGESPVEETDRDLEVNTPPRRAKRAPRVAATPTGSGVAPKAKKPTTASLAASMEQLLDVVPSLSTQIQDLAQRHQVLENRLVAPSRAGALGLSQPLSSSLAKSQFQPAHSSGFAQPQNYQPEELVNLEEDKGLPSSQDGDLAKEVLAQSQALTALVNGPTYAANLTIFWLTRGIVGQGDLWYMERFGGFGRHRDLGLILYQVMGIMDFLQVGNMGAARDATALLAVCIDQAVLDGGRFDLAALLTLQEDPPSSIFINRQQSTLARSRAFSQLADQRWVTTALAFVKELDLIQTKRLELSGQSTRPQPASDSTAKAKPQPKRKGKGANKGQGNAASQDPEEE
ncbi:unnamed protein product [Cladocopium goreaui]|uniref:Uncharacterized protein n=1 Tax=Cladocopium goreaui TaxID=2562237 RepID=A0A9P1FL07_9DINO|nr:unnamed protein product [Cladocopium goreaui]